MTASTLSDVAVIIGLSAGFILGFGVLVLFAIGKIGKVGVAAFGVHADVEAVERLDRLEQKIDDVNTAVNHRKDGDPTLVERVGMLEDGTRLHRIWEHEVFEALATQLGVTLPPHPLKEQS